MAKETTPLQKVLENNLSLWNEVSITNPSFTKKVNFGAHKYTAINPQTQLKEATRIWGKYGEAWGIKNIRNQVLDINDNDANRVHKLIVSLVTFYYPGKDGKVVEFDLSNSLELATYTSKGKFVIDSDAFKKIETNSISKALSKLGFNSDVFEGHFDEEDYIKTALFATKSEGMDNAQIKASIKALKQCTTIETLIELWTKKTLWQHEEAIQEVYQECMRDFKNLKQTK